MAVLQRWQLVEIAVGILQDELEPGTWHVEHDVRIPDGEQIDLVVRGRAHGREIARVIEVRDRVEPVNLAYVNQVAGEVASVGADRGTIVTTSRFTRPALKRVRESGGLLDAFVFDLSAVEELAELWPGPRTTQFKLNGRESTSVTAPVELTFARYHSATSDEDGVLIAAGTFEFPRLDVRGATWFIPRRKADGDWELGSGSYISLPPGFPRVTPGELEIRGHHADGTSFETTAGVDEATPVNFRTRAFD